MHLKKPALVALTIMISCLSCNLEINTVDPQSSADINASKHYGFFIDEFEPQELHNQYLKIKEMWTEYVWFNRIKNGKVLREKIGQIQLSFKVDNFPDKQLNWSNYIVDWVMKDGEGNYVGQSNGVFTLTFKDNIVPDSIIINISKFGKDRTQEEVFQFRVVRKLNK